KGITIFIGMIALTQKYSFTFFFCLSSFIYLYTQPIAQSDYQKALEHLVLVQDSSDQIPIKQLGQKAFKLVLIGLEEEGPFAQMVRNYTAPIAFSPDWTKTFSARRAPGQVIPIIAIQSHHQLTDEEHRLLGLYLRDVRFKPSIWVIFGQGPILDQYPQLLKHRQSLIFAPESDWLYQSLAAQLIFGGIGTQARLKVPLGEVFPVEAGIDVLGPVRLGYAPPEVAALDADLLKDSIKAIAQEAIQAGAFPGMQVLIARKGKIVFHETYGHHQYDTSQALSRDDLYDFASLTKITSALPALMQLHGQKRFDLDVSLQTYWPTAQSSNKGHLTFRRMLSHHAQLQPWIPYWRETLRKNGRFKWRTFKKRASRRFPVPVSEQLWLHRHYQDKIYQAILDSPLNKQEGYVYSGLLFYLLPEIVSRLSGLDYEEYLNKKLYLPLGATTLGYNPLRYYPKQRIVPTEKDTFFRKEQLQGTVHDEGAAMMGGISANAGLFGTANDLAKLLQCYLNEGEYGGEQLIPAQSIQTFTRRHYAEEDNRRGLGFDKPLLEYDAAKSSVSQWASPKSYGHAGYTGTFCWVDPQYDLIYIFLSNRVFPTRENRLIYQLNIRPRLHEVIYQAMSDQE
ncbi:MAG: serine hydrolase, partial [Bacteroidota bacterium]